VRSNPEEMLGTVVEAMLTMSKSVHELEKQAAIDAKTPSALMKNAQVVVG